MEVRRDGSYYTPACSSTARAQLQRHGNAKERAGRHGRKEVAKGKAKDIDRLDVNSSANKQKA